MKTKYMAVAIALALGAGAAFADVQIDGNVTGGVQFLKAGDTNAGGIYYDAVIGVAGNDKLDYGGKLIWRVEQEVLNTQSGRTKGSSGNGWGNRQAYIGLTGDYGTFRSGNTTTPLYDTLDNIYANTGAEWLARDYGFGQSDYAKSTVRYDTPDLYGFNASAAYLFEDQGKRGNKGYDAAATYKWQGLGLQAAYQKRDNISNNNVISDGTGSMPAAANTAAFWSDAAANGPDSKNWYAGANYKFDSGFGIGGGFKRQQLTNAGEEIRQDMWLAQGSYQYGKHGFYLTYFNLGNLKGQSATTAGGEVGDSGSQAVDARYNYNLSKHSIAFVDARYVKNDDNASVSADDDAFYTGTSGNGLGQNSYRVMGGLKTWF